MKDPDFYSMTVRLQQDKDESDTESVICQELDVTVQAVPGSGAYLILSTQRWAAELPEMEVLLARVVNAARALGADIDGDNKS